MANNRHRAIEYTKRRRRLQRRRAWRLMVVISVDIRPLMEAFKELRGRIKLAARASTKASAAFPKLKTFY